MKKSLFTAKAFRAGFNEIRSGSLSATSLALAMHMVTRLERGQRYYAQRTTSGYWWGEQR